jgi:hypothetical protein
MGETARSLDHPTCKPGVAARPETEVSSIVTARTLSSRHARITPFAATLAALALATSAGGAREAGLKVRFSALPDRVLQGGPASVTVAGPAGVSCTLTVRYGNGSTQPGLATARARNGRAQWSWRVPETAATGPAKLVVACGRWGRLTGMLPVVAGPKQPGVTVTQQGFSQRYRRSGSSVSYGIVLTNTAAERDALDVTVLTNFVDATNTVLGTDRRGISGIPAGAPYYLGDYASLPATPIDRLEITVQVSSRSPRSIHEPPVADLRVVPDKDGFVDAVVGQVANDRTGAVLTSSRLSSVLFDVAGNVVGGAYGSVSVPLPHNTRAYFSASSAPESTPMANVALARVSVEPRFVSAP